MPTDAQKTDNMAKAAHDELISEIAKEIHKDLKKFDVTQLEKALKESDACGENLFDEIKRDTTFFMDSLPNYRHPTPHGSKLPRFGRITVKITEKVLPNDQDVTTPMKHIEACTLLYNDDCDGGSARAPSINIKWERYIQYIMSDDAIAFPQAKTRQMKYDVFPSDEEYNNMAKVDFTSKGSFEMPSDSAKYTDVLSQQASQLLSALVSEHAGYTGYDPSFEDGKTKAFKSINEKIRGHPVEILQAGETVSLTATMNPDSGTIGVSVNGSGHTHSASYTAGRGGKFIW